MQYNLPTSNPGDESVGVPAAGWSAPVVTYPWRNPSAGYWVDDKSGHFSLMISQNLPLSIPIDPFSSTSPPTLQPGWINPNPPWKVPNELFVESFVTAQPYAYFGTCTVEMDDQQPHLGGNIVMTVFSDAMRGLYGHSADPPVCVCRQRSN
jgi:hypothetical protein